MNKNISKQIKQPETTSWKTVVKGSYVYVLLILVVIILSVLKQGEGSIFGRGHFLNWSGNIVNLLRNAVPIFTLSGGFTLLVISGYLDLSVGSAISLGSVTYVLLLLNNFGFFPALILTLLLGIVLGFINGFIVLKLRITPVIATLITLNVYQGIARLLVKPGDRGIGSYGMKSLPAWINNYGRASFFNLGLPLAFFVAIVVIAILVIIQRKTILGKYAVAIGGNKLAAELSGINTIKIVWLLYIMVGFLAALAAVARASYMSFGDPAAGLGMEVDVIIAVLLGGTLFAGGEGSVLKSAVGALIIMCITSGLMTVLPSYWQSFIKGAILVFAVTLSTLLVREKAIV